MILGQRSITVTDGLEVTDVSVGRKARAVIINNASGCYALVAYGSNYVPRSVSAARKVIYPHTYSVMPVLDGSIGIYFISNLGDPAYPPSIPGGQCTIQWFDQTQAEYDSPQAGAFSTDTRSAIQDTYPYTVLGESFTDAGETAHNFTLIAGTGYQALRLYWQYTPAGAAVASLIVTQTANTFIASASEVFQAFPKGWNSGGGVVDIPIKYMQVNPSQSLTLTPRIRDTAVGDIVRVTPVLLMGGYQYHDSIYG